MAALFSPNQQPQETSASDLQTDRDRAGLQVITQKQISPDLLRKSDGFGLATAQRRCLRETAVCRNRTVQNKIRVTSERRAIRPRRLEGWLRFQKAQEADLPFPP